MKKRSIKLDQDEKRIKDSLEHDEWHSVAGVKRDKQKIAKMAEAYLRRTKDKRISIRIFGSDLEKIKARADEEGLPYQTLVTSILHKYTTGRLVEKNNYSQDS